MNPVLNHTGLLMEMLSIPALSRKEEKRSTFLEKYLGNAGMQVKRVHNNLLAARPGRLPHMTGQAGEAPKVRPLILLNSHMDTVPPNEGWKTDPFEPRLEKGRITALGSNDAGASVVTLIAVFLEMDRLWGDQADLLLLLSAEEEVSGNLGLSAVNGHLGKIDAAIVGEPTGMRPAVAERGLMVLDAMVHGKAGHAARDEGINAIYLAMNDIKVLSGMQFPEKSVWLPDPSARVTMISAGTAHNVVPDACRYVVDVRSNDKYSNECLLEMIRNACAAGFTPRSTRLKPTCLDPDHPLMEAIRLNELDPFGSSTLSDMAQMDFPAVKMGPGDSSRSHTSGEFILLSEMEEAISIYGRFLTSLKDILIRDITQRKISSGRKKTTP
jgi:acetylornithine deacetylase